MRGVVVGLLMIAAPAAAQTAESPRFNVERLLTLGADAGSDDALFVDINDVTTSPSGDIYVLDTGDRAVKVYSPAGRFVRRFGRAGGGPGEFQLPTAIRVDSIVHVSDPAQQRMSYFALDGRHVRTARTPEMGERVGVTPAQMSSGPEGGTDLRMVEVLVLAAGGRPDTLLRLHSGAAAFHPRAPGMKTSSPRGCHSEGARAAPALPRHPPATEESSRPGR
jgi:hypothetical protein